MTKIQYDFDTFSDKPLTWMKNDESPLETIQIANDILEENRLDGYTLTLRQLYYQILSSGFFVENTQRTYKNLGNLITKARNNGLVSWQGIEDRGRGVSGIYNHEEDDHQVVNGLEGLLTIDKWARQDNYVEVWVEKDALINVISRGCARFGVPRVATKGYLSASEAWRAGQRFQQAREEGKECHMIHLGDHDPEGIDMTRDNLARLEKYSRGCVNVDRIALNMDQIREYNPPENYAKASSSRYEKYVDEFGDECWELDALKPAVIVKLIQNAVEPLVDMDIWNETVKEQQTKRRHLSQLYWQWDGVKEYLDDNMDPDDDHSQYDDDYDDEYDDD